MNEEALYLTQSNKLNSLLIISLLVHIVVVLTTPLDNVDMLSKISMGTAKKVTVNITTFKSKSVQAHNKNPQKQLKTTAVTSTYKNTHHSLLNNQKHSKLKQSPQKTEIQKRPLKKTMPKTAITGLSKNHKNTGVSQNQTTEIPPFRELPPDLTYPKLSIKRNQHGNVMIETVLDNLGNPTHLKIFTSSGYKLLDQAALKWVSKLKFTPNQQKNDKVPIHIPVRFKLNQHT